MRAWWIPLLLALNVSASLYTIQPELLDAKASIPPGDYGPHLNDQLSALTQGAFGKRAIVDDEHGAKWYGGGFETFYAPVDGILPALVLYDISDDTLNETGRVPLAKDVGLSSSVFSPAADRPYGAVSTYESTTGGIIGPHEFFIDVHAYDEHGQYAQAPESFDMGSIDGIYNLTIAYNGLAGVSGDGKYMLLTYALGVGIPGVLGGQQLAVLDSDAMQVVAAVDATPTGIPGEYSFAQTCNMWETYGGHYSIVCAEDSWNLTNPRGSTAFVALYSFDGESLERIDSQPAPYYIEDLDVSRGLVVTTGIYAPDHVSNWFFPNAPYENGSPDPSANLRVYRVAPHGLEYLGGLDLGASAHGVAISGKTLAVASAPATYTHVFTVHNITTLSPTAYRYTPQTLTLYDVVSVFSYGLVSPYASYGVAPLTYGIAFSGDRSRLATGGHASYQELGSGFKDTSLLRI